MSSSSSSSPPLPCQPAIPLKASTWWATCAAWPSSIAHVLLISLALHTAFLLFGLLQDAMPPLRYTDIDYDVFTDAARLPSPYDRATYRYTPLLAWLMRPNAWFPAFGKCLFVVADGVLGYLLYGIVRQYPGITAATAAQATCWWLWNPFVVVISTRGNAESVQCLLVMATLAALMARRDALSAAVLGLAVHFKIYPAIYVVPIVLHLTQRGLPSSHGLARRDRDHGSLIWFQLILTGAIINRAVIKYALVSAATYAALTGWMYVLYGDAFLDEALLYHWRRRDHRHNFSIYFYAIYLEWSAEATGLAGRLSSPTAVHALLSMGARLWAFAPQLGLVGYLGVVLASDLMLACFAQTFAFVMLNKVCTSQYFMWYLCFAPLLWATWRGPSRGPLLLAGLGWVVTQGLWLHAAFQFEFQAKNTFRSMWFASLAFLAANTAVLVILVRGCRPLRIADGDGADHEAMAADAKKTT